VLSLRSANYVVSGQLLGFSPLTSLRRDIAPNIVGPVLVLASLDIGTAILLLSGLSVLGLFPGLAILTVVIAFNLIGDALRDVLDPTSKTLQDGGTTL
jgi:peptide/nickel transport system permease protein